MIAGTAVTMFPLGIVMVAETVAYWIEQLLSVIVSSAPALSVSVIVGLVVLSHWMPCNCVAATVPLYVLVEELLVVMVLKGVIVCAKVATADTLFWSKPRGSPPLTKFKVPDTR